MRDRLTRGLVFAALLTALGAACLAGARQAVQPVPVAWVDPDR